MMIDTIAASFDYDSLPSSAMLPATALFVNAGAHDRMRRRHPNLSAIDYRCHTAGRVLGRNYPPHLLRCLRRVASGDLTRGRKSVVGG